MISETLLAAIGDAANPNAFGGTPWHLLQEGRQQGLIQEGLALDASDWLWRGRRYAWNLFTIAHGRGGGGYQYSTAFLEKLWAPFQSRLAGKRIINLFQLFPPSIVANSSVERWYYLDQTLLQLFDTYGIRAAISPWIAANALERERLGYQSAAGIIVISQYAARCLQDRYGIPSSRIHIVARGANLDSKTYDAWSRARRFALPTEDRPLRLVFVGKHPYRKGLDRLLRAVALARRAGANCVLRVIGCRPEELAPTLRAVPGVEWVGFIDKRHDPAAYLNAVGDCDVGCLLSRAEAGGIGLREYHALGLAVLGPNVGGSPDHVIPEASVLVSPAAEDEVIADHVLALDRDRERVARMRAISWARRQDMTWAASVRAIGQLLMAPA